MYCINLPYPKIKVIEKNHKYVDLLLLNYCSSISEFTSISQYTYYKIALSSINKEISNILNDIITIKMRHLEIIGELIILLGGKPCYYINNKKKNYWCSKLVNYDTSSIKNILDINIKNEKACIKQYKETIKQINDKHINSILKRIILDDEFNMQLLTNLYTKYVK